MHASKWLNPNPGSDIALAMAMVKTILDDKTYDVKYIKEQSDLPFLVRKDNYKYIRETDILDTPETRDNLFYLWNFLIRSQIPDMWVFNYIEIDSINFKRITRKSYAAN